MAARLLVAAVRIAFWFIFCIGIVALAGGPMLLGVVIAAAGAFVGTFAFNPGAVEAPPNTPASPASSAKHGSR